MYNKNIPTDRELPSTKKLIKSTLIAAVTAGVLLVTVVMPSEYGIDPTGAGKAIGLKKMGEIKVSLAKEAAADKAKALMAKTEVDASESGCAVTLEKAVEKAATIIQMHEMQVTLAPNEGTEIKAAMSKGATLSYEWWSDGGKANFDVHADSKKMNINYHNYSKGSDVRKSGELTAAFDGSHGWFWRNRSNKSITITLKTNGEYSTIKHMK